MRSVALRSSAAYRQQRRMYLASLLGHYRPLLQDSPGLLTGPLSLHLAKLLSLCKAEVEWLVRHHGNVPNKK